VGLKTTEPLGQADVKLEPGYKVASEDYRRTR